MANKTIGYAQFLLAFGDREANLKSVERLATSAAAADLLVFPELATTGYEFKDAQEVRKWAEPLGDGQTSALMLKLAAAHQTTLVIGYPELAGDKIYNAGMLATPEGGLHGYRKIHFFSREKVLFSPGDAPPPVIETPAGRVGLMICFDWFYPETARLLALRGAQIIAHPSNLVLPYCQRAMYARSVENRVYSITANRIGAEDRAGRKLTFTGGSQVLDIKGNVLVQAPTDQEHVGLVEIDPTLADDKRINEYNDLLNDRRAELYGGLAEKKS